MAAIKMDELLVTWLGSDDVYEKVLNLIEKKRSSVVEVAVNKSKSSSSTTFSRGSSTAVESSNKNNGIADVDEDDNDDRSFQSPPLPNRKTFPQEFMMHSQEKEEIQSESLIPPFYSPWKKSSTVPWAEVESKINLYFSDSNENNNKSFPDGVPEQHFHRVTKDICDFPGFFNGPLYKRILSRVHSPNDDKLVTLPVFKDFWESEMEPYDAPERFFRLVKQPESTYIKKDDFLPFIEELLACHPGLEFLSNHAEFQEKYAITVITRIFYCVNTCHNGKITSRQIRKSDLLEAFHAVDAEEDINKITRYFSYEHFYVLYCRFWELDHDRDYRITREDLMKYGENSLNHMIVDRIFEAAPRPFENSGAGSPTNRDYLSYEDFIYFMLSEEDKANEISVRYWFTCIDVDGDGQLNNMEMRSFYAVQLHRMQCFGHDIVPFEDMLCQMIDMIKPSSHDHIVVGDFLQPECSQVSGALFDALFNLNKYLQFEQRDPFTERQKREDEFDSDWDRFAYVDYNRLALEEEAREEEAMEIDWVTVDDEEDEDGDEFNSMGMGGASEAPF